MKNKFKKITILYADDLSDINPHNWKDYRFVDEAEYFKIAMSKRIEWVEKSIEFWLSLEKNIVVATNDYSFMRLLECFVPQKDFCIFDLDTNCTVNTFVDLKPNPTLKVAEFLFRFSVKKAMKRI